MSSMDLAGALHQVIRELDGAAEDLLRAEYGITHSQLAFLKPLALEGELDVSTLAARTGVSVAAVSKRIDWFASRGLIRASHPDDDAKRMILRLTPKGRRLATSAMASLADGLDVLLAEWPAARRAQLQHMAADLAHTIRSGREQLTGERR